MRPWLAMVASMALLCVGTGAGDRIGNGTTCRIVDAATGQLRDHRVLLFVDALMVEIALNWLISYDETCREDSLRHVEIVCMDPGVRPIMESLGHACSSSSFELSYPRTSNSRGFELFRRRNPSREERMGSIWLKRVEIVAAYLDKGVDVVLSDADAIWLKGDSLFRDLSHFGGDNSLVVSRAWWPHELYTRWGATACMGFAYFRGADGFSAFFFRSMLEQLRSPADRVQKIPDDQVAFNTQLSAMNISWPANLTVLGNTQADRGVILWEGRLQGVVLLPHERYPRQCRNESGGLKGGVSRRERGQVASTVKYANVAHCRLSKGEMHAKKVRLSAYRLWRLTPDWRRDLDRFKRKLSLPDMLGVMQHGGTRTRTHNYTLITN